MRTRGLFFIKKRYFCNYNDTKNIPNDEENHPCGACRTAEAHRQATRHTHTIDWAEKISLGSKKYKIINIDK
ncbi:hypothetical protein [Hallella sp.]|uniref:hypothetical protein n=1 Tax=Hallella sp. TaxID=2980186 RepID=UPI00307A7BC2